MSPQQRGVLLEDDLLDPAILAAPHPCFASLREHDPVHWSERHKAWLVSRYDDVAAALTDPRLSSNRVQPLLDAMSPEQRSKSGALMELINGWMVVSDPPEHTRLRRLASSAFGPQRIMAMEGRIRRLVDELIDAFIAEGREDLIAHFAYPLPATVIAELIGAPREDRDRFREWSNHLALVAFGAGGEARGERHARAMRGLEELLEYIDGLIERTRGAPGESMIANLLAGDEKGDRLTVEEMKAMCALMLFAGHETTTSTIASAVLCLTKHPDQLELLRADPRLAGKAVEEVLRFEGAIKVLIRTVSEEIELRGRRIERGQRLYLLLAAANRDPQRFEDPDELLLTRSPNPHLAFGRGVHACIGAQLARLEMRVALTRLLERLPGLRLAEDAELQWQPSLASRALTQLRVRHDGAGSIAQSDRRSER
ncbi:MAG TPA: cytochrome P450 [Solirubrobacteraceae bacterium]|jgi:cytochrome P450